MGECWVTKQAARVVGGCIRGLGMRRVRLCMGGRVVMASSGGNPIQMSKLWPAPGLRWRIKAGGRVPKLASGGAVKIHVHVISTITVQLAFRTAEF